MNTLLAPVMVGDLLARGAIAPSVAAPTKRQALAVVSEIAARAYDLKASRVLDALVEREALSTTGVGHGVAIPHAHVEGLTAMSGIFVRLRPPVQFEAVDEEPVDLIFAILAPPDAGSDHLRTLARVARTLRSPELRLQLRQAQGPDAIRALFAREPKSSAA
ncbi:MAG TPA: PTS sugar transporter subunit IIA [Caulobacteraceae bacterium]